MGELLVMDRGEDGRKERAGRIDSPAVMRTISFVVLALCLAAWCRAVTPSPAELDQASRWAAAKVAVEAKPPGTQPCLRVIENHGPVQIDARGGEPLQIAGKTFRRGLFCHAPSKVIVELPAHSVAFHAEVGVDARAG